MLLFSLLTSCFKHMLDTVISDNARLGIMPNLGVKGNMMADGAATPYDSGSPMQDGSGYLGSPDYGAAFSPIVQSGGATPGGFTEYQPQGFGGGLSPYSSRSPGGYSPSVNSTYHLPRGSLIFHAVSIQYLSHKSFRGFAVVPRILQSYGTLFQL